MSSVVHASAVLGAGTTLGEGCSVAAGVTIGTGCRIGHHVVIHSDTRIGNDVRIDDHASLGKLPMRAANSATTREQELPPLSVGDLCIIGTGAVLYRGATIDGKVPVIYRVDLKNPSSFFVAQNFPFNNKDLLYVANASANRTPEVSQPNLLGRLSA